MSLFSDMTFKSPVIRVEDKDLNLAFLQKNLGMKVISEENALAFLAGHHAKQSRLVIEESPAYRTRAVKGSKKLNCLVIKADAFEIGQLLARGVETSYLFKGKEGYTFEAISPQGDAFLLHAEQSIEDLEEVDAVDLTIDRDFKGLSDFHVEEVVLNVPNPSLSQAFYEEIFDGQLPLQMSFEPATGPDLTIEPQVTWDLEFLEFQVPATYDLVALYDALVAKDVLPYMDKKARVLVISDPSKIDIWFTK